MFNLTAWPPIGRAGNLTLCSLFRTAVSYPSTAGGQDRVWLWQHQDKFTSLQQLYGVHFRLFWTKEIVLIACTINAKWQHESLKYNPTIRKVGTGTSNGSKQSPQKSKWHQTFCKTLNSKFSTHWNGIEKYLYSKFANGYKVSYEKGLCDLFSFELRYLVRPQSHLLETLYM